MSRVFKSVVEIQGAIENACFNAIQKTANQALIVLKQCIENDFYNDDWAGRKYVRTYQFMESAMVEMLSKTTGEIFMNPDEMHYKGITGLQQLDMAEERCHGNYKTFEGIGYWSDFMNWCDANLLNLLKTNLRNEGLNVR